MSGIEEKTKSRRPIRRKRVIALFAGGVAVCAVLVGLWVFGRRGDDHPGPWRCFINLRILGKAMNIYAGENDGQYPTADKWCDLLLAGDYVTFRTPNPFVCRRSGATKVESSFALNANVGGRKRSEIGPDVVLLFETDFGVNPLGRQGRVKDRQFPDWLFSMLRLDREARVYKLRWNQVGGPEILTTEYHDGEGCMVLFNNGRVDFVRTEELGKLKWETGPLDMSQIKVGPDNLISWSDAKKIIRVGDVVGVFQTHSRSVTIRMKDGTDYHTTEPRLDDAWRLLREAGREKEVLFATE